MPRQIKHNVDFKLVEEALGLEFYEDKTIVSELMSEVKSIESYDVISDINCTETEVSRQKFIEDFKSKFE